MASESMKPPSTANSVGASEGRGAESARFVLGIIGDSGSGKSTVSRGVRLLLGEERVTELKLDDYHRYTREERRAKGLTALNPQVHNLSLLNEHLQLLRRGRPIRNRTYDHVDGTFGPIRLIEPKDVVLARGLLGYPTEPLRRCYDLAVFLMPEPELLFRWKLRRDVRTRGYAEAEVLKNIAQHLLDAKTFVTPQAERADVLVRHRLDDWEDPDSRLHTSIVLRGGPAEALGGVLGEVPALHAGIERERVGEEEVVWVRPSLSFEAVEEWGRSLFDGFDGWDRIGECQAEEQDRARHVALAFVQVLVARLTEALREDAAVQNTETAGV
jgi:uridine kinase